MDKFLKKYTGKEIERLCGVNSEDFRTFARDFRGYIVRSLPGCKIAKYEVDYYAVSAFLETECNGEPVTIYLYYDTPMGCAIKTNDATPLFGVLVRAAEGVTDYHGARNHFASLASLAAVVDDVAHEAAYLTARKISMRQDSFAAQCGKPFPS